MISCNDEVSVVNDQTPTHNPGDNSPAHVVDDDTVVIGVDDETIVGNPIRMTEGSTTNLSQLKAGEAFVVEIEDSNTTMNLEGATIDSLFVVEHFDNSGSRGLGTSRGLGDSLSHGDANDVFVILPQEDGRVSFSGSDVGIEGAGQFKIKKLGSNAALKTTKSGNNYFQYKLKNTGINYREQGYPDFMWPTYLNYYVINLNDSTWARYKDQKVVVCQAQNMVARNGGSETTEDFGLVDIGSILYGNDPSIRGLYDLNGKNFLFIYSFLRTGFVACDDLRFETYILLPDEVQIGAEELTILDLPHAVVFRNAEGFSTDKDYVVSLKNVPDFNTLGSYLMTLVSSSNIKVGEHNGDYLNSKGYIQNISRNNDGTYDASVYLTGVSEDFLAKFTVGSHRTIYNDYGSIGIREATAEDIALFNEHLLNLEEESGLTEKHLIPGADDQFFTVRWAIPENSEDTYEFVLKASGTGFSQKGTAESWFRGGAGGDAINEKVAIANADNPFEGPLPEGFIAVYTRDKTDPITWYVTKAGGGGVDGKRLESITFSGTPAIQHSFSEIDVTGCVITAHYSDGTEADVTDKVEVANSQTHSEWWDHPFTGDKENGFFMFDTRDRWLEFSYYEAGVDVSVESPHFMLHGKKEPNTQQTIYTIPNIDREYETFDVYGYENVNEPVNDSFSDGYLVNPKGASAGATAWAVFTCDDYNKNTAVTAETLQSYITLAGAKLTGGSAHPAFGCHDFYEDGKAKTGLFAWTVDGTGTKGAEFVVVFGTLANDVNPATGIKKSDFVQDEAFKTFFIKAE